MIHVDMNIMVNFHENMPKVTISEKHSDMLRRFSVRYEWLRVFHET